MASPSRGWLFINGRSSCRLHSSQKSNQTISHRGFKSKLSREICSERRQNPKTLIGLQKFRNSKSYNTVNLKLAKAQTVRFTGVLFRFEFLKISSEWNASFWILSLCQQSKQRNLLFLCRKIIIGYKYKKRGGRND